MNHTVFEPNPRGGKYVLLKIRHWDRGGTRVTVKWGAWNPGTWVFAPMTGWTNLEGFILQLQYRGGKVPLRIETDGTIEAIVQSPTKASTFRTGRTDWYGYSIVER